MQKKYSDEEILNYLKSLHIKLGRSPNIKEANKYSMNTYRSRFGTFNKAIIKSGLTPLNPTGYKPQKWNRQDCINALTKFYNIYQKTPTYIEYCKFKSTEISIPAADSITQLFGSWNNAILSTNLKINLFQNNSDEELLNEIKQLYIQLNKVPSIPDYNNLTNHGHMTIVNRFGSWNNALILCGFEPNQIIINKTNEEMLNDLIKIYELTSVIPTINNIHNYEFICNATTYQKRFGSWNKALTLAGLEGLFITKNRSDAELLDDVIKLGKILNRTPTIQDVESTNWMCSIGTYFNRFGAWSDVINIVNMCPNPIGFGVNIYQFNQKFDSIFEYRCYCELIKYFNHKDIIRRKKYWNKTKHNCDFYIEKIKLWIEVSSINWEKYIDKIEFKRDIVLNIHNEKFIFIDNIKYLINLLESSNLPIITDV